MSNYDHPLFLLERSRASEFPGVPQHTSPPYSTMTTSLGKRKERDNSHDEKPNVIHGYVLSQIHSTTEITPPARSTLFVSNLPYTATSTDLKTLFSDFAPVRSAFVVLEPGSGVSKGVGYVSFAIREDAQLALDKIAEEGLSVDRRQLRAQWADSRVCMPFLGHYVILRFSCSEQRKTTQQRQGANAVACQDGGGILCTSATTAPTSRAQGSACHTHRSHILPSLFDRFQDAVEEGSQTRRCREGGLADQV